MLRDSPDPAVEQSIPAYGKADSVDTEASVRAFLRQHCAFGPNRPSGQSANHQADEEIEARITERCSVFKSSE